MVTPPDLGAAFRNSRCTLCAIARSGRRSISASAARRSRCRRWVVSGGARRDLAGRRRGAGNFDLRRRLARGYCCTRLGRSMESGSRRGGLLLGDKSLFIPEHKASDSRKANCRGHEHGPMEMFRGLASGHARQSAAGQVVPRAGAALRKAERPLSPPSACPDADRRAGSGRIFPPRATASRRSLPVRWRRRARIRQRSRSGPWRR
jgi:hypothetical protein